MDRKSALKKPTCCRTSIQQWLVHWQLLQCDNVLFWGWSFLIGKTRKPWLTLANRCSRGVQEDCLQHQTVCYRRDIQKTVGISQIQITSETHPATSESCFQILLKWSNHSIASGDSTCVTCAKFGLNQHDLFYSHEDLSAYVHCLP